MVTRFPVNCIKKSGGTHEHITDIGGVNPTTGGKWTLSVSQAIEKIENETNEFFVTVGFSTSEVVVVKNSDGTKYLRTKRDNTENDNLLNLPTCV